jgi:putative transposase
MVKGECGIWQRRHCEHTLRDETDWERHIDYIHYNPVKHEYVGQVADQRRSTFYQYVKDGIYPKDWGGNGVAGEGKFGEV